MRSTLLISESSIITKTLKAEIESLGDKVEHIEDALEALTKINSEKYDLFIFSLAMQGVDGVQFASMLRNSQGINAAVPMVLVTSGEDVTKLFNVDTIPNLVLKKNSQLVDSFMQFYQKIPERNEKRIKVLYIDDDKFVQKMIQTWMKKIDYIDLQMCGSVADLKDVLDPSFDMIVSDNLLGDGELKDVLGVVSARELLSTPVLVYTGSVAKLNFDEIKRMGNIIDILPKPFDMKNFLMRVEAIRKIK